MIALPGQFRNCVLVAYGNHLVKEEVEVDFRHLPDDWQELGKPGVDLLACRGVKHPLFIIGDQFREPHRIAMLLAVLIRLLVLIDRMEHVHRETHVEQVLIINVDKVGEQLAVVVEEHKRWPCTWEVSGEARVEKQL